MSAVPARLTLRTPDGQTVVTVGSGSPVTVTGEPLELLLFAFGRNAVRVDSAGMTMSSPRCGPPSAAFESLAPPGFLRPGRRLALRQTEVSKRRGVGVVAEARSILLPKSATGPEEAGRCQGLKSRAWRPAPRRRYRHPRRNRRGRRCGQTRKQQLLRFARHRDRRTVADRHHRLTVGGARVSRAGTAAIDFDIPARLIIGMRRFTAAWCSHRVPLVPSQSVHGGGPHGGRTSHGCSLPGREP